MWALAAEKGNTRAQNNLAIAYWRGDRGVEKSAKKAAAAWRQAADQGDASAQYDLGVCLRHGQGVPQDEIEAKRLYKLSAKQNHLPAIAALAALERLGPAADLKKSNKYLRKAKALYCDDETIFYEDKIIAKTMFDDNLEKLGCSNKDCPIRTSADLSVDKRLEVKLKPCAACRQEQYCSKKCGF